MNFTEIENTVQEKIAQIGELLDISDEIARGEKRVNRDQMSALKLSIDARLRLINLWKPQEVNNTHTGNVFIIERGQSETLHPAQESVQDTGIQGEV